MFDQVGGNAVFVSGYNRRVAIRGCLIRESGGSGVTRGAAGLLVTDAPRGSAAARLGMQYNDFIQTINGRPAGLVAEFRHAIAALQENGTARLELIRNQKPESLTIPISDGNRRVE